jgi:2-succinyl-5-enolpyruvyl-6-hydroxy-3-cyclohexene-1-carboxylate synthase
MLSKQLKQWLRAHPPKQHFHLQTGGWTGDPFNSQPITVNGNPVTLLDALYQSQTAKTGYLSSWQAYCQESNDAFQDRKNRALNGTAFSEWEALEWILERLPDSAAVHFGNSMAVRYGSWILPAGFSGKTFSNRGTSGIDGCVSTAVGYAAAHPETPCFLLVGDVSFFYDSNAFWNDLYTDNLKVILLNNHGGNIFRIIDGPRQLPECESFLETRHQRQAENLCRDLGVRYMQSAEMESLKECWPDLLRNRGPMVLELLFAPDTAPALFPLLKA